MNKGLEKILGRIEKDPGNTMLVKKCMVLITEGEMDGEKADFLLRLSQVLTNRDPEAALEAARLVTSMAADLQDKDDPRNVAAMRQMIIVLKVQGENARAARIARELRTLQGKAEASPSELQDLKGLDREDLFLPFKVPFPVEAEEAEEAGEAGASAQLATLSIGYQKESAAPKAGPTSPSPVSASVSAAAAAVVADGSPAPEPAPPQDPAPPAGPVAKEKPSSAPSTAPASGQKGAFDLILPDGPVGGFTELEETLPRAVGGSPKVAAPPDRAEPAGVEAWPAPKSLPDPPIPELPEPEDPGGSGATVTTMVSPALAAVDVRPDHPARLIAWFTKDHRLTDPGELETRIQDVASQMGGPLHPLQIRQLHQLLLQGDGKALTHFLWGEVGFNGTRDILRTAGVDEDMSAYWGTWLDMKLARSKHRMALAAIYQNLHQDLSLDWFLEAWERLPDIWNHLGLRGFSWKKEDGISAMQKHLQHRPWPAPGAWSLPA